MLGLKSETYTEKIKQNVKFKKRDSESWTFLKDFITFMLSTSNIHGLNHISYKYLHPFEYVLWFIGIILSTVGIYWLSKSTWDRYQNSPTVISIENDYQDWITTFPSITVCPENKILENRSEFYSKILENNLLNAKDNGGLYEFMTTITYWNYTSQPTDLKDYNKIDPKRYMETYAAVKNEFSHTMNYNDIPSLKTEDIKIYTTEIGICYGYLSKITLYSDPAYWQANRWDYVNGGPIFGSNLLDGDNYFQFTYVDTKGFKVFIHSPEELPDSSSKWNIVEVSYMKTLGVSALSLYSTEETKALHINQRHCRFLWESDLKISPVYSYNLCRMQCRLEVANKHCGCAPYFYRPTGNYKICNAEGLVCLSKIRDLLTTLRYEDGKKVNCICLPSCNDVRYVLEKEGIIKWSFGAELRWGIIKYPRIRFKREILFGITDVLVSVGGTAGLFLGCSVLSFVEIIYFISLRLLLLIRKNRKQNRSFKSSVILF